MIDFINKYKAIVEKNNLHPNVLNDIACSLCIADQNWGTNDKKLSIDALLSTVDLFEGICSHKQVFTNLPRVQVKRLLLDTLIIALKFEDKDVNDELTLSSEASRKMASRIGVSCKCLDYYDEVTADRYIDLFSMIDMDFSILVDTIKELSCNNSKYLNFTNHKSLIFGKSDLILPIDIRFDIKGYTSETMSFISSSDFNKHITKLGLSTQDYVFFIKMYYLIASLQNLVMQLEKIIKENKPLFCTICSDFCKYLKRNEIGVFCCNNNFGLDIIADGNCMKIKLFRDYMSRIFDKNVALDSSSYDMYLNTVKSFNNILVRWCE